MDDADDASVVYDGVNDRTRTQAAFDDASGLPTATLAVLMRCEDATEDGTILSFEDPLSDNGVYRIEVVDGAAAMSANGTSFERQASSTEICDGVFYLVVAVFASQTDRRLYVGSVEVASGTTNLGLSSSGDREFSVADGIRDLGQNDLGPFEGRVSHAAIFDSALSSADVEALFRAFRPRGRFFDLVQETSLDKAKAGIVRMNTSDVFSVHRHPGLFFESHFESRLDILVPSGAHKYVLADIERGTHNDDSHDLVVVGTQDPGTTTIIEFDDNPDPYLGPEARVLAESGTDPIEEYTVVEENGVDPVNNTIEVEGDTPNIVSTDEMWIRYYDYRFEPHLHVEVAQEWHLERTDPLDLFGVDGPPGTAVENDPNQTWIDDWTQWFGPSAQYGDEADLISAPNYFRLMWGDPDGLPKWKLRAVSWRNAIEKEFPEYATLPLFISIAHREDGDDEWLHEMDEFPNFDPPVGPQWYIEMTEYCVDIGLNVVGWGDEQGTDYELAMDDYLIPAMQAVAATDPKPTTDRFDLNTGVYASPMAIFWALAGEGTTIPDNSGSPDDISLERLADLSREAGMNGPALRVDKSNEDSMYVAATVPNTELEDISGFSLSIPFVVEQPLASGGEVIAGWNDASGFEPSVTVLAVPPAMPPGQAKLQFKIRYLDDLGAAQTVILEADVLDYGEPAHYILTVGPEPGVINALWESKLYRKRVGEDDGVLIDSDATEVDFTDVGANSSSFAIGGIPGNPATKLSSCEVEHVYLWKRVLTSVHRESVFDAPYQDP